jgi:hypothetical protein
MCATILSLPASMCGLIHRTVDLASESLASPRWMLDRRTTLQACLLLMAQVNFAPNAAPIAGRRWRRGPCRERAAETLISRRAGRCLANDCMEAAEDGGYCPAHDEHQRSPEGIPQDDPEAARRAHDDGVDATRELLAEVGDTLRL